MLTVEMRMGLYSGWALSDAKMSNVLVLSVAINKCVTPGKHSEMWMAAHTASALEKKMASVGHWIGSRHWYPVFSDKNQMPKPHADALTWIVSMECLTLPSCQTMDLKKNSPVNCWTCSTNHASSCRTVLLIFILPHIWALPAVFVYILPRPGLNKG